MKTLIISMLFLLLVGCYTPPSRDHQAVLDRSTYFPLAVYSPNKLTVAETKAYTKDVRGGGTMKCLVGSVIFTFGLAAPLCAPLAVADADAFNEVAERQQESREKSASLITEIKAMAESSRLVNHAINYLKANYSNADVVTEFLTRIAPDNGALYKSKISSDGASLESNSAIILPDDKTISQKLQEQGYPIRMELKLALVQFIQQSSREKYCLSVRAIGRTVRNRDNQEIISREIGDYRCKTLDEWNRNDAIVGELDDMYRVIATSLVDYLVYVYEDSIDHFIGLKILSPEVDIISSEKSESGDIDQGSGCNREEGCGSGRKPGAKSWPRGKAANYGDLEPLQTKGGVRFVNTGMQPRLIWSPPSIPNAQVIRYDVRIYRGIEFNGIASSRFSGLYVLSKYIRPAELVYERLGLDTNSHIVDTPLEACSWYFWTVRAGFNYLGTYRTTEWSAVEDDNRRTHMYPLRTEADDLHSGCWDRPVFYGPCDRKIFENDRICVEETQDEKASNVKAINAALK